jgi:hypothetical protein
MKASDWYRDPRAVPKSEHASKLVHVCLQLAPSLNSLRRRDAAPARLVQFVKRFRAGSPEYVDIDLLAALSHHANFPSGYCAENPSSILRIC